MNKTMKKITAALLALCCVTGMTAAADGSTYNHIFDWGSGALTWEVVDSLEQVDLQKYGKPADYLYYVEDSHDLIIEVKPRQNTLFFVLQDDLDIQAVSDEVAEIVQGYLPDNWETFVEWDHSYQSDTAVLRQSVTRPMGDLCAFELTLTDGVENKTEIESGILLALARKHLISEFYGFGETADFWTMYINGGDIVFDYYHPNTDLEKLRAYLAEHYPDYELDGNILHGTAALSVREKAELIYELKQQCGVFIPLVEVPVDPVKTCTGGTGSGHNKLEKQGDVTLDCELGITDVIALNRNLMVGDPLCCTARVNSDIDGDGTPDEADSLAILKEIVEITKDFKAQ